MDVLPSVKMQLAYSTVPADRIGTMQRILKKSWIGPMGITNVQQLGSLTLIVLMRKELEFVGRVQVIIDNDLSKSIRSIARNIGVSKVLIMQVMYEDIYSFSYK